MNYNTAARITAAVSAVLCVSLMAAEVFASGFYLPGRGVRPLGRAGAYVASGDGDLNSLWYNPANLSLSDGLTLTVDASAVDLSFDFHRAPRIEDDRRISYDPVSNSAPPELIPQIMIGGPTGVDKLSWAAGFYTPYMSSATFPENGPQRYTLIDNKGSLMAFLNAAVSYEISENIRVGAGFQNVIASFRLVSVTSGYTGPFGRPEDQDLDILTQIDLQDFFSPAGNVGMWVSLGPALEAAISAQTPVLIHDDDSKLDVRMPSHPAYDGARLSNDSVAAGFTLPAIVRVALRLVVDPVDVELAGVWEGWSVFDEISAKPNDVNVENVSGVGSIPVGPLTLPHNYRDTFSIRLGGDYRASQDLSLRAGYTFETGAVPDDHYSVFLPDSDKHMLAAGLSWNLDKWSLDAGTAYYFLADREITDSKMRQINPTDADDELATVVGNGDYSSRYFVFGLGANYRFE